MPAGYALWLAGDRDRACRVMEQALAHGPEQQPSECASTSRSDDDESCMLGGVGEQADRMQRDGFECDLKIGILGLPLTHSLVHPVGSGVGLIRDFFLRH